VYDQLVQVMLNLILNALDATEEGAGMEITTKLIPETDSVPARIGIHVRDEGHGIPKETQEQIFQPYYTTKDHGTGLGLFVCRQLTRHALGGEILLVKSTQQGTEFMVTLPVITESSSESRSHSSIVRTPESIVN
jgi:two-component system NtrC family sensor kinase